MPSDRLLASPPEDSARRLCRGDEVGQRIIDQEVPRLLWEAEVGAMGLLGFNLDKLDRIISLLLEGKTLDGAEMAAVVGVSVRGPADHRILAVQAVIMKTTRMNKGVIP